MTKRNDIYTVENIDAKNKIVSEIINQSYRQDALSEIKSRLAKIKEDASKSGSPSELVGIMLWSQPMTIEKFRAKYENMITFYKEVTNNGEDLSSTSAVRECYVHIPEMTGMLPYPDFENIKKYYQASQGNLGGLDVEDFNELKIKCRTEFEKILMYPRFYSITQGVSNKWSFNEPCIVKSLGETGMNSEVLGKFIKTVKSEKR